MRSLRSVLMRQWAVYAVVVAAIFSAAAIILLFLMEDAYIDSSLEAAARIVGSKNGVIEGLPANITLYPIEQTPPEIRSQLTFVAEDKPFEMRRANGQYLHVMLTRADHGGWEVIVYDATEQLVVTSHLRAGLGLALVLTAIALTIALLLARLFVQRAMRSVHSLAVDAQKSRDPKQLREIADKQAVSEFRTLLRIHADLWEMQRAALKNEQQTLVYLGHELRTPLQSARTSLAILHEDASNTPARNRLARAIARLIRASHAVLWLATEKEPELTERHALHPIVMGLVEELSALAASVDRSIDVDWNQSLHFFGPREVAEVVVGNLLINALQHGSGVVVVTTIYEGIAIRNSKPSSGCTQGFGLGLEIVDRLAERMNWRIIRNEHAEAVEILILVQ